MRGRERGKGEGVGVGTNEATDGSSGGQIGPSAASQLNLPR